jgi:hypothetical protein
MRLVHSTVRDLARLIAIRTRKEYHRASARLPPFRTGDGIPRGVAAAIEGWACPSFARETC